RRRESDCERIAPSLVAWLVSSPSVCALSPRRPSVWCARLKSRASRAIESSRLVRRPCLPKKAVLLQNCHAPFYFSLIIKTPLVTFESRVILWRRIVSVEASERTAVWRPWPVFRFQQSLAVVEAVLHVFIDLDHVIET